LYNSYISRGARTLGAFFHLLSLRKKCQTVWLFDQRNSPIYCHLFVDRSRCVSPSPVKHSFERYSPFPDLPLSTDAISCDLDKLFGSYHPSYHGRHQTVQVLSNIRIWFEFAGQKCGSNRLSRFCRGLQFFTNITSFQVYRFLIADYNLRRFFNLNAYCGAVTFATFIFVVIMAVCSIVVSLL